MAMLRGGVASLVKAKTSAGIDCFFRARLSCFARLLLTHALLVCAPIKVSSDKQALQLGSARPVTRERNPVHDAPITLIVVYRKMLGTAIVPERQRAG